MFDGDSSKTLRQAQCDKHEYILRSVDFNPGTRLLDIGCGWGGLLKTVADSGGFGTGVTLSSAQLRACCRNGLEVHLMDWKDLRPETFGTFDALASIGAFEHFCNEEEFNAGNQEVIYARFFSVSHSLLRPSGKLFLQTMLWGRRAPKAVNISLNAPKGSDEYVVAVLKKFYPGSCLPIDVEQITRTAAPHFRLISSRNGKADYIRTMTEWGTQMWRFRARQLFAYLDLLKWVLTNRDARHKVESLVASYNRESFKRELMDHERLVFERV
jgi:cyclopropane-fatty-acyl-phospholipid synthase